MAAGVLAIAALATLARVLGHRAPDDGPPSTGITTDIALLLMFTLGAYTAVGDKVVAAATGLIVATLLNLKTLLHDFADRIGGEDMRAILQFVAVACVILPILPDQSYGPFGAINPREIWWMVVLIIAISLVGYACHQIFEEHLGVLVGGFLGGLASSTATMFSYARLRAVSPAIILLAILGSSAIMPARVIIEALIIAPRFGVVLAQPVGVLLLAHILVIGAYLWWRRRAHDEAEQEDEDEALEKPSAQPRNPATLRAALIFGVSYGLIKLLVAAGDQLLSDQWFYVIGALSGLTSVNAITLSTAQLVAAGEIAIERGWRLVMVGVLSNLAIKATIVAFLATPKVRRGAAILLGAAGAVGAAALLWMEPTGLELMKWLSELGVKATPPSR